MDQNQKKSLSLRQRWENLQPTKATMLWACAGAVGLTILLGFTVGGWQTAGKAEERAQNAAQEARGQLAAAICVERFKADPEFQARFEEFRAISGSFRQRQFIEAGGWSVMPGDTGRTAGRRGADLCAATLARMELPQAMNSGAEQTETPQAVQ